MNMDSKNSKATSHMDVMKSTKYCVEHTEDYPVRAFLKLHFKDIFASFQLESGILQKSSSLFQLEKKDLVMSS